ncbi:DsbE family thiol:disulfide interchange protein [Thioflexithrix psekupsensis]|uniref:Thiol:disulfide interchange protein n=1 Tax=Thioflexithrix psekupsensis TaxID=1570016 RepID=A0A251X624_9GAMM|nr:DsbE family thiol:disulfide interchange protein [Thioflexithrix psekupsensis]OUD13195.1 thiol:disulfide interchange protein [Thioflexithrix psekupsensis]
MFRAVLPLVIFAILMVFLYIGLSLDPRAKESVLIGKPAPRFNLPLLERPNEHLNEQVFLGQVSLVNAWASWCVSCRHEHPLLMQLAKHTDIPIYGLNYKDEVADALQVLRQQGSPYVANFVDTRGRVGMDWGVIGTPETFVVDQQGIVRYKHTGPLTVAVLETEILPLIEKLRNTSPNQSL